MSRTWMRVVCQMCGDSIEDEPSEIGGDMDHHANAIHKQSVAFTVYVLANHLVAEPLQNATVGDVQDIHPTDVEWGP